jgi:hypothetical protein
MDGGWAVAGAPAEAFHTALAMQAIHALLDIRPDEVWPERYGAAASGWSTTSALTEAGPRRRSCACRAPT